VRTSPRHDHPQDDLGTLDAQVRFPYDVAASAARVATWLITRFVSEIFEQR